MAATTLGPYSGGLAEIDAETAALAAERLNAAGVAFTSTPLAPPLEASSRLTG